MCTGLGEGLIEKLNAAGVTTVEALADMTPEQLEAIEGIGPKTVEKISLAVNNYFSSLEAGGTVKRQWRLKAKPLRGQRFGGRRREEPMRSQRQARKWRPGTAEAASASGTLRAETVDEEEAQESSRKSLLLPREAVSEKSLALPASGCAKRVRETDAMRLI